MRARAIFFLITIGYISMLLAQEKKPLIHEFELRTDNDSYLWEYSDRYYTNGFFLTFRRVLDLKTIKNPSLKKKILAFEIGQRIYTPQAGVIRQKKYVDRPFTAYLYAQGALFLFYRHERFVKFSADLGVIGQDALGEPVQIGFHRVLGFYDIIGWERYQMKSEWGLNLSATYAGLLFRKTPLDLSMMGTLNLGTMFSGAEAACLLRIGWFSPLENSLTFGSRIDYSLSPRKWELVLFARPAFRYVAYDATIQGGLFRKDKGPVIFGVKPWVFSQSFGLALASGPWTFEYTLVFNTKEVKSYAQRHQWGSFRIAYAF